MPTERGQSNDAVRGPVFAPMLEPPMMDTQLVPPVEQPMVDAGAVQQPMAGAGGEGEPMPDAGSMTPDTGTPPVNEDDPFDAYRNACVAHINMYRATLGLDPLVRVTADAERCSDEGAEYDTVNGAHQSASKLACRDLGAQNTCPGYPAPGGDVIAALEGCLDQMWAEGPPPVPVSQCIQDYSGCFLQHGHYINMSEPEAARVACGFFQMSNGRWWMNQDFGR